MEGIIKEAKELAEKGVRELMLIAQDTTRYGRIFMARKCSPSFKGACEDR